MTLDYTKVKNWPFEVIEHSYTARDAILYALGVGLGHDPVDERQLRFVYEKELLALPSMACVLGYPGFWVKDPRSGIDWMKVVHGEQALVLHKPIPAQGSVLGRTKIAAIVDKGSGKGALLVQERRIFEKASGERLATVTQLSFCRGDGGFSERPGNGPKGGDPAPPAPIPTPERAPDAACDLPTLPQAALLYRLSGDPNPLHAEPGVAKAAGFPGPVLHGLATYGVACHALLRTLCDYDPARLKSMTARFSAPVYPGETIRVEMWREGGRAHFRARTVERDVVVLSHGTAGIN